MKTDLTTYPSQFLVDGSLIFSRGGTEQYRSKLNCLNKCVMKPILLIGQAVCTVAFANLLLIETLYFGAKAGFQGIWSVVSCKNNFKEASESIKKAVHCFFGVILSPFSLCFPETILLNYASDNVLMREPYNIALSHFKTWDKKRQKNAWNYALEHQEKIQPRFFKRLKSRDVGKIWEKISLRLFFQQFSFVGKKYEGLAALKWSIPDRFICESIKKWLLTKEGQLHQKYFKEVISFFRKSLEKDYLGEFNPEYQKIGKKKWTYCPSGYSSKKSAHANGYIFGPKICAKIDTGPTKTQGIKFYRITKKNKKCLQETIFKLHQDSKKTITKKQQQKIFNNAKKELGLKKIGVHSWKQKSGSCSYTSSLVSVLAFLIGKELSKISHKLTPQDVTNATNQVLPAFNTWNAWHRYESFKAMLPVIQKQEKKEKGMILIQSMVDCVEEKDYRLLREIIKIFPTLKTVKFDFLKNQNILEFLENVDPIINLEPHLVANWGLIR